MEQDMSDRTDWSQLLREMQAGRTQEQFAAEIGVSQSLISRLLRGVRKPGLKVVRGLMQARPEAASSIGHILLGK